jgi:hypothetical protein
MNLQDYITILMPTSPIPGHPSTELIENTIREIRKYPELALCKIIIMADGVREEQRDREEAYRAYKRELGRKTLCPECLPGCWLMEFQEHTHQASMTKQALKSVTTPLIFFVEHDTHPGGEIDWQACVNALSTQSVNYIRFHIHDRILPEHENLYGQMAVVKECPLVRTAQWSQRPHLARADWYRWLLETYFGVRAKTMIEDLIYGVIYNRVLELKLDTIEQWGLWVYQPSETDMLRSFHSCGRGSDRKFSNRFAYDGDRPEGAPAAEDR